jgi:hypothetical protein
LKATRANVPNHKHVQLEIGRQMSLLSIEKGTYIICVPLTYWTTIRVVDL